MTLFEYLSAAYVLMLSFAVLRAISGVPHAVRSQQRYWVHISWLTVSLVLCLVAFWAFWPYREVEWTIFIFMNALAIPALIYAFVSLLVPPDPASVASWRDYFFGIRVPLFSVGAVLTTTIAISNQSALGVPSLHPSQLGNYVTIAMHLTGLLSAKPSVHVVLAIAYPAFFLIYFLQLLIQPDSAFRTQ